MSFDREELWNRRLENWALWCVSGGASTAVSPCYSMIGAGGSRSAGTAVPTLVGEALDTDALIAKLPEQSLKDALVAWYIRTGTIEMKAADLQCHRDTLSDRVDRAIRRLDELWWERKSGFIKSARLIPQSML